MSGAVYAGTPRTRAAAGFRVSVKEFVPGARLERHCDAGGSICVVLSGRVHESDARQVRRLEAGGALFRPADQPHADDVDCHGARVVTVSATGDRLSAPRPRGAAPHGATEPIRVPGSLAASKPRRLTGSEIGPVRDTDPDAAFDAFYAASRHNPVLEPRTRLMLHLAAAMAAGCEP